MYSRTFVATWQMSQIMHFLCNYFASKYAVTDFFLQISSLHTYTGKPVNTHAIHDEVAIMLLISVKR